MKAGKIVYKKNMLHAMNGGRNWTDRSVARALAKQYLAQDDPLGWFEALYSQATQGTAVVTWADMVPNPHLVEWLNTAGFSPKGRRALKIGCGLGDDAEELVKRGFATVGFDVSPTAIAGTIRCCGPFQPPSSWFHAFDFVLESYTLQVLPASLRKKAIH
jgi:2-polyprenyl-3-methyl-5-hydroxy-6-metoxy-1,4-benzoquinol methylase